MKSRLYLGMFLLTISISVANATGEDDVNDCSEDIIGESFKSTFANAKNAQPLRDLTLNFSSEALLDPQALTAQIKDNELFLPEAMREECEARFVTTATELVGYIQLSPSFLKGFRPPQESGKSLSMIITDAIREHVDPDLLMDDDERHGLEGLGLGSVRLPE